MFNYDLKHIKGKANCIADCLFSHPTWLVGKDKKSDSNQDPILTQCSDSRDEFCLRVITEARHILKDNPALVELEAMGKKDPDYCRILDYVQTKRSFKELPSESEGSTMGGIAASISTR